MKFVVILITLINIFSISKYSQPTTPYQNNHIITNQTISSYKVEDIFINNFFVSVKRVNELTPLSFFVNLSESQADYRFRIEIFNQNEELCYINHRLIERSSKAQEVLYGLSVSDIENLFGYSEFRYSYSKSPFRDYKVFASFSLYFPYQEILKNNETRRIYWEASVYPDRGEIILGYEEIKGINLEENILLPTYNYIDLNELKLKIEFKIKNKDYLNRIKITLSYIDDLVDENGVLIPFQLKGKTYNLAYDLNKDEDLIIVKSNLSFNVDKTTHEIKERGDENTFKTDKIYLPKDKMDYFQNIKFNIEIRGGSLTFGSYIFQIGFNFLKDYSEPYYQVIGEIDLDGEIDDLKEINP